MAQVHIFWQNGVVMELGDEMGLVELVPNEKALRVTVRTVKVWECVVVMCDDAGSACLCCICMLWVMRLCVLAREIGFIGAGS